MTSKKHEISLRDRKYAQTKLTLLNAALERLEERPFEEVGVKELCEAIPISEPTFFNYFPRKTDLLVYFIQLWTIEVSWHARQAAGTGSGLGAIEAIFEFTAQKAQAHPAVMGEIIAFQARMSERPDLANISLAERLLAFPELEGVEDLPAEGLDSILPAQLARAIDLGELPGDIDMETVFTSLVSIFFGVPVVMCRIAPAGIGSMYRRQLHLLWEGVRAGGARATTTANP